MTPRRIVRIDRIVVRANVPAGLAGDAWRALVAREITQRLERSVDLQVADTAAVSRMIADSVTSAAAGEARS